LIYLCIAVTTFTACVQVETLPECWRQVEAHSDSATGWYFCSSTFPKDMPKPPKMGTASKKGE